FNDGEQEGAGPFQSTTNRKRRWSTARAYLSEARRRPNLAIRTNAHATRVTFENGRTSGVEFLCNNVPHVARARGEIIVCAGVYARSDPRLDRPDIQLNFSVWSFADRNRMGAVPHPFPGFTISAVHLRPEARGTVQLKSPDPLAAPSIRFNFLKTRYDIDALTAGLRLARQITRQPALASYVAEELVPGAEIDSDAEFEAAIRRYGISNLH